MLYRATLLPAILVLASCASASEENLVDSGTAADARVRADADLEVVDASTSPEVDGAVTPDAAPLPDAAIAPDAAPLVGDPVVITEIVDATLPGGLPKFIELTNHSAASVDMTGFTVGVYSNGSSNLLNNVSVPLTGTLAAGASYIVSFEAADSAGTGRFQQVYGFDPNHFAFDAQINGDDAVVLFVADGNGTDGAATGTGDDATIIDLYGIIGEDGTGKAWEYTDGFATRKAASITASATFNAADWDFGGAGALTGQDEAGIAAATNPGTH